MKRVKVGNIELAVLTCGERGYPLLLVHGFPLDHTIWQPQIDAFAEHCRVIAPDLRGFGASGVTEGVVTMEQMADDLSGLLDALKVSDPVIFCGLSMGGYVGWQFWRKYSQRVRGMILCDTRAVPDTDEAATNRRRLAAAVMKDGAAVAADAMLPKMFAPGTNDSQPELVSRVRKLMAAQPPAGIAAALEGMATRPDARGLLPTIDAPTLVIVGEHDAVSTVEEMRQIADALPDPVWVAVPAAGHLAPLENPVVVNEAIAEFITM